MKQSLKYIFLILFCVVNYSAQSQVTDTEIKAAFVERFTRFIEWPQLSDEMANSDFKVTVIGNNNFAKSLKNLFSEIKIKNRTIHVNSIPEENEILNSQLVIICNSNKRELQDILQYIDSHPILVISNSNGFAKAGTHINMIEEGNYIRYEINQKALEKTGLKVSSLLMASAKIITSDE